jgi:hypothetical protein
MQVGAIHPLYLYSAMSDTTLPTSSWGRRASCPHISRKIDRLHRRGAGHMYVVHEYSCSPVTGVVLYVHLMAI